jgi:hypothetical protein
MPLPLAPVAVFALRAGLVTAAVWAVRRTLARSTQVGRTDQRAEDALDGMAEGLAVHAPADRAGQNNAGYRMRRVIRWPGGAVEVDLAAVGRLRLRRLRGTNTDGGK